jgi:hypothetical protein
MLHRVALVRRDVSEETLNIYPHILTAHRSDELLHKIILKLDLI